MAVKEQFAGSALFGLEETSFLQATEPAENFLLRFNSMEIDTDQKRTTTKVNAWRTPTTRAIGVQNYAGTFEMEYDPRLLQTVPLVRCLLELVNAVVGNGNFHWTFRAPHAQVPKTGQLLFAFDGGPWALYRGVVIERMRWTFRAGQVAKITVGWKAASRTELGADPVWSPTAQDYARSVAAPPNISVSFNFIAASQIQEASFEWTDPKTFGVHGPDGVATRWARSGNMSLTGTIIQYWDTTTVDLAALMRSADPFHLTISANVSDGGIWDGVTLDAFQVYVEAGEPVPVGKQDVMMNASFRCDVTKDPVFGSETTFLVANPLSF